MKHPYDLILFAGQSNMAGRGDASLAPLCPPESDWEYRAVTAPGQLFPLEEPFGEKENRPGGLDDGAKKTGSLVSSFVAEYYTLTGRPVVGVSASEGGTSTGQWLDYLAKDALTRFQDALAWLRANEGEPAHICMLWCQGETDGDKGLTVQEYKKNFLALWEQFRAAGIQRCGLIQIGHFNYPVYPHGRDGLTGAQLEERYSIIRQAQEELCREEPGLVLAATFADSLDLMKDQFHYRQPAYDQAGRQAARVMAGE